MFTDLYSGTFSIKFHNFKYKKYYSKQIYNELTYEILNKFHYLRVLEILF